MTTSQTLIADRYRLHNTIGQGGMGRVWLATDELLHRQVAVKEVVLPNGLTPDEVRETGARASREARAAARLSHHNVITVYDIVVTDTVPWIVMEYLPSRSLDQVIVQDGPMTAAHAARTGLAVLTALRAAHAVGVLHRDVKPSNVLITDEGRVVLTDFGLAVIIGDPAVTRTGMIFGSPSYMAPERARDAVAGPASDLWSLGAMLYYAVEGRSPYQRSSALATVAALASEEPDPTRQAGALGPVLDGLLRRDPAKRLDAAQVERMLRAVAEPSGATTAIVAAKAGPVKPAKTKQAKAAQVKAEPAKAQPVKVVPAAVAPVPAATARDQAGRAPAPAPGRKQDGGEDRIVSPADRRQAVVVGIASLVLIALVAGWLVLRDGGDPVTSAGGPGASPEAASTADVAHMTPTPAVPSTVPSVAPSVAPSPAAQALPDGWHVYKDRTGFSVAVPASWKVSREGTMVYFREQGGSRVLGIDQTTHPKSDPVADWTSQEKRRVNGGDFPGYHRVRIEAVDYFLKCADWEFTYNGNSGRLHVNNRGTVTSAHRAYGMWWSTLDSRWDEHLPDLRLIQASFVPAP